MAHKKKRGNPGSRQIIEYLTDTDLYKFTMQQAVIQHFPELKVRYRFTDRTNRKYPDGFAHRVVFEVHKMKEIMLRESEEKYLRTLPFLTDLYVDFLRGYRYDPDELSITQDDEGHLIIEIEGYWYKTILWEVPLMALISELYFEELTEKKREKGELDLYSDTNQMNDQKKAELMVRHNAYYADFGSRRRFSFGNQERVIKNMVTHGKHCFVGTSNIYFAMKYGLKPIGTMAHEWIMGIAAVYGYKMSNDIAFKRWTKTYGGDLGIALTDTFTTPVFFDSFNMKLSKLFDGMRHDSGNPYDFADKCIAHYKSKGIDPMTKVLVFSDGLTVTDAVKIKEYCVGKIKCSFGIGTHFTNDVGETSLNIVIKISEVFVKGHWIPAVKLSDNVGKNTGDPREVQLCKDLLRIE